MTVVELKGHGPHQQTGSTDPSQGSSSLIDLYLELTKDAPTPDRFRRWTAIHAVGAACTRRVWTQLGINRLHPNLFLFLVGPPGTGKSQAINPMSDLLRRSQAVGLAPTDMTKQGLLDALAKCSGAAILAGDPFDYHFMAICISELSDFMSQYDGALAGLLTNLFDCIALTEEQKRGRGDKSTVIINPGISFVMGTATGQLGTSIHKDMWNSGFMARVIMVYDDREIIPPDMFAVPDKQEHLADEIVVGLRRIGEMTGPMIWTRDTQLLIQDFRVNQAKGAPTHDRLAHYTKRRWLHLAKLCMIAALADERMQVEPEDFHLAKSWLLDAEAFMPEIFKELYNHEDSLVYKDLQAFVWEQWGKTHRPVPFSVIVAHLTGRATHAAVPRIVQNAEAAGFIERVAGTSGDTAEYVPGANYGPAPGVI